MEDCICAIASAVGGAIAILRLSGENAEQIGGRCWHSLRGMTLEEIPPRTMVLGNFSFQGSILDPRCIAVRMPAPQSYTGEDTVEFHCHGGALCTRTILQALLKNGARLADPGEFTRRAFLNGKMDLTQAEAVSEMISAGSEAALKLAGTQLNGAIGQRVTSLQEKLDAVRAEVESRLDFPEEELDFRPAAELAESIRNASAALKKLAETKQEGELLRGGVATVIAGAPNAGKSSLLNQILGRERAIVSEIPGTTRDTIEETVQIHGIPFRLVDTAGIREKGSDAVESAGMQRSCSAAESADLVLWLTDATTPDGQNNWPQWTIHGKLLLVGNKSDLLTERQRQKYAGRTGAILVSAKNGDGLEELFRAMENAIMQRPVESIDIAVSARHAECFAQAATSLEKVLPLLIKEQWELAAIPLRAAIMELGVVTGKYAAPDVLDHIFSKFCIGK